MAPNDRPQSIDEFEIAGMDLNDFSQDLSRGWKCASHFFFSADVHHSKILEGESGNGGEAGTGPAIATLEQLAALKAIVAAGRSKSRDWIDLYILEKAHAFGLEQWRMAYQKAGLSDSYMEDGTQPHLRGNRGRRMTKGSPRFYRTPRLWRKSPATFSALRAEYETNLARRKLT